MSQNQSGLLTSRNNNYKLITVDGLLKLDPK